MAPFARKVSVNDEQIVAAGWDDVLRSLPELKRSPDPCISVGDEDDEVWLVTYFVDGLGYYVSGCGTGDGDYYTLVDPEGSAGNVVAWFAGDEGTYQKNSFVTEQLMLEALQCLFDKGERKPTLAWELASVVQKD